MTYMQTVLSQYIVHNYTTANLSSVYHKISSVFNISLTVWYLWTNSSNIAWNLIFHLVVYLEMILLHTPQNIHSHNGCRQLQQRLSSLHNVCDFGHFFTFSWSGDDLTWSPPPLMSVNDTWLTCGCNLISVWSLWCLSFVRTMLLTEQVAMIANQKWDKQELRLQVR